KLTSAHWEQHLGHSESLWVNASTWALMLSGKLMQDDGTGAHDLPALMKRLVLRIGEPAVRLALREAMTILGHQFVLGRTIEEALVRVRDPAHEYERYSF